MISFWARGRAIDTLWRLAPIGTHAEEQHAENLGLVLVTAVIALNPAPAYGAMSQLVAVLLMQPSCDHA
jgi:hypothetical protein